MTEEPPLVRQWILLRTLCARRQGCTVKELAQETGRSEQTIRRDLITFQQAGFPLKETKGRFGRKSWRIEQSDGQPDLSFTFDEAIALYLAQRFIEPLAGTHVWTAAQGAFRKIRAMLGSLRINVGILQRTGCDRRSAAMPRNETTVDSVTLEYHLPDLPTAQHKAGLAGLVLQIQNMQLPERGFDPDDIPILDNVTQLSARVTVTERSTLALFNDLYSAEYELNTSEKKRPGKQEPVEIRVIPQADILSVDAERR